MNFPWENVQIVLISKNSDEPNATHLGGRQGQIQIIQNANTKGNNNRWSRQEWIWEENKSKKHNNKIKSKPKECKEHQE